MDFAEALIRLRDGGRVRRTPWTRSSFVIDVPGSQITVGADRPLGKAAPELVGEQVTYAPHTDLYVDGHLVPWTPNQTDMHADDWENC